MSAGVSSLEFVKEPEWRAGSFPTYRVEIPTGGEGTLAVTSKDHVSFDCNHHCINGQPGDRCFIVCRGIEYGAHIHFNLVNGEWVNKDDAYNHVSRVSNSDRASKSAEKWIVSTMLEILNQFHMQHPEVFFKAEHDRIESAIDNKREELKAATEQCAILRQEIEGLRQELCDLENA